MSNKLTRLATRKAVIMASALSVLYLIPYATLAFRGQQAKGMLIDQRLFTTPATFHHILMSYGLALRTQYVHAEYIDLAVAGVAFSIALIVSYAAKKRGANGRLSLIPIVAGILNTLKVMVFIPLILSYPHESSAGVWLANAINLPKDLAMLASIALLLAALFSLARRSTDA